jgi:hypothetical protein
LQVQLWKNNGSKFRQSDNLLRSINKQSKKSQDLCSILAWALVLTCAWN